MADERELDLDLGTAGASGRREYERRKASRERKTDAPKHEKAWATGAAGEEALAASLARRCPGVFVLHDRRMPSGRANIDHLAVAPSGVYVIDAKQCRGKIEVRKPLFGDARLVIAGRDKTKLVEGLTRQAEAVRQALSSVAPRVPVQACFCFLNPKGQAGGSGLPLFQTPAINGYSLHYPRKLAKRLNQPGHLDPRQIQRVAVALATQFPAA